MHSYKLALRAKGIRPLPAQNKLRSSLVCGGQHIVNPAIANNGNKGVQQSARGEASGTTFRNVTK